MLQTNSMRLLPVELFVGLECCLDDEHARVKRAAAIALYTLEKPVPKVSIHPITEGVLYPDN